jgi:hypothetical protein
MQKSDLQIIRLIESFPSIAWRAEHYRKAGEFNVDEFMSYWGTSSSGERHALLFVANVWNPGYATESKWNFDLFDACGSWDTKHRLAAIEWMKQPFWP